MPVRKFRTVEDMSRPQWRHPGDPELYRTMARLWAWGRRNGARRFPAGVYRARSIREINERNELWNRANFEAVQASRRSG